LPSCLALIWDPADPDAAAAASDIDRCVRRGAPEAARHAVSAGCVLHDLTSGTTGRHVLSIPAGEVSGAVFGRLFRRACARIPVPPLAILDQEAGRRIASSRGASLMTDYWGAYLAFLACSDGTVVLTEPTSSIPCFYCQTRGVTLVFSHLEVCPLPDWIRFDPDLDFIAKLLAYDKIQTGQSGLRGVRELAGGRRLHISGGQVREEALWDPRQVARNALEPAPEEAAACLRETTSCAVRTWGQACPRLALNLSGGLDSAIVAACLMQEPGALDMRAVHFILQGGDPPEAAQARAVARDLGIELAECLIDPADPLPPPDCHPLSARPFREFLGRRADAERRQALGLAGRTVFTGQGGDHLFLETRDPLIFADYLRRHGPGRRAAHELLAAARLSGESVWHVLAESLSHLVAGPRETAAIRSIRERQTGLNRLTHERLDASDLLPVWACVPEGLPPAKFAQVSGLAHMIQIRESLALPGTDETVHPLISQPLVELCLQLPAYLLCHGGRGRGLVRQAFAGRLPDQIRLRRSKGDASRFYTEQLKANRDLLADTLMNGALVANGLINRADVEAALRPGSYGVDTFGRMILVCYVIEAWLGRWTRRNAAP